MASIWRCTVCGYIHKGDTPPDVCPVCGASSSDFEPFSDPILEAASRPPGTSKAKTSPRVLILGAGIAGLSAAEAIRTNLPDVKITIVSREPELPYFRLNLTRYLAGEVGLQELTIHATDWYENQQIQLLLGTSASWISLRDRLVYTSNNATLPWDKLVITTGASPIIPKCNGVSLEGVFSLRTLPDATAILDYFHPGMHCIIIGGGLLGLETAGALALRGGHVSVLENSKHLMPRQLTPNAASYLAKHISSMGIQLVSQAITKEIFGSSKVQGVRLDDERVLAADMVILSTGVSSDLSIINEAGIHSGKAISVDDYLQTNVADVFCAGDAAEHRRVLYGSWNAAQFQGKIAGLNVIGNQVPFGGIPRSHTLKILNLPLVSIGKFLPEDGNSKLIDGILEGSFYSFCVKGRTLVGAIMAGDSVLATKSSMLIESAIELTNSLSSVKDIVESIRTLNSDSRKI